MKLPFISEKAKGVAELPAGGVKNEQFCDEDQSIRGLSDLYAPKPSKDSPVASDDSHVRDVADVLVDTGKLTFQQCEKLRAKQSEKPDMDTEAALLEIRGIQSEDILKAKVELYDLKFEHIEPEAVDKQVFEKLDIEFIKENKIVPVSIEQGTLIIATADPEDVFAVENIKRQAKMDVRLVVCSIEDIKAILDLLIDEKIDYSVDDIISDLIEVEVVTEKQEDSEDLEQMAGQSPVIKFVNYLISNAINEGASDIHIEPKDKFTRIRYRIDGVLFETMQAPSKMHPAVVSRIKIMSNLDISERRLPQDGKISVIVGGRGVDLRVSILPTSHGEKVVIRVLDSKSILLTLEQLGMETDAMETFRDQIVLPHGILLVTGPTGSGKSTTLYTALCQMDGEKMNVSTVEDPVEYELGFCNQVQVNEKIGLTFAASLRSLLRQDPDIIMIGEIRDNETARVAVQAALTGHLVLSTLHTNDAPSSITRLVNIGIDPYLIAASLNAVLAQRLVRRICPKCKEVYKAPTNMRKYLEKAGVKKNEIFHGAGCDSCRNSGYAGRVGIYELLVIDDLFKDMINKDSSVVNMRRAFIKSKQSSLFDDGIKKIKKGLTTTEEVLRVTEVYGQSAEEEFVENID